MSNRVLLLATTFVDNSGESYGFRVSDEYDKAYYNNHPSPVKGDMEVLKLAIETDEFSQFADFLRDNELGLTVNDVYYDWSQIKEFFE
jgi:hypothetical protein